MSKINYKLTNEKYLEIISKIQKLYDLIEEVDWLGDYLPNERGWFAWDFDRDIVKHCLSQSVQEMREWPLPELLVHFNDLYKHLLKVKNDRTR